MNEQGITSFIDSLVGMGLRVVWPIVEASQFRDIYAPQIFRHLERRGDLYLSLQRPNMRISFDWVNAQGSDSATTIDFVSHAAGPDVVLGREWDLMAPIDWGRFEDVSDVTEWIGLIESRVRGPDLVQPLVKNELYTFD